MKKIKLLINTVVVVAVVLALVLPGSAIINIREFKQKIPFNSSERVEIQYVKQVLPVQNRQNGINILMPSNEGNDSMPSITSDLEGNTVVTWTHQPNASEGHMGIAWSNIPDDQMSWLGWIISITGNDKFWDTALIQGPEQDDYKDLYGVYMQIDDELSGYYKIFDINGDPTLDWEFYNWQSATIEPVYSCVSDMGFYNDNNYPDMWGPFNFYIYHEIYQTYDIPGCPVCFHTDLRAGTGGVGYFDGQAMEKTAPASDADIADLGDRFHTIVQYDDPTGDAKIVWKKIVPAENPDYEFTSYQDTIVTGENPSIAAYDTGGVGYIAVAYVDSTDVKCIYSNDDGNTWSISIIDTGNYPDIYAIGEKFYCAYIKNNNLYLTTSSDNGVTWTTPEQVNEVDGTVVNEKNSVDVHTSGIVWVDSRGNDSDIYWSPLLGTPATPTIIGPNDLIVNRDYEFIFKTTDPEGENVFFYVDWGDGNVEEWIGPYSSGAEAKVIHSWTTQDTFTIRCKAKDTTGAESGWATHIVSTPRDRKIISRIFEIFPNAFPLLQILLGL
jgi:hypothetical protein